MHFMSSITTNELYFLLFVFLYQCGSRWSCLNPCEVTSRLIIHVMDYATNYDVIRSQWVLIVCVMIQVQQKRWKVETNSRLDSVLLLSSVNLPGGELVRDTASASMSSALFIHDQSSAHRACFYLIWSAANAGIMWNIITV